MKKILTMSIIVFILLTCKTNDIEKVCDVEKPVDELTWLSGYIEAFDTSTFTRLTILTSILKDVETSDKIDAILVHTTRFENTSEYEQSYFNCMGDEVCREVRGGVVGQSCRKYDIIESKIIYKNY